MEVELCYYETTFKGNLKKRVHPKKGISQKHEF